MLDFSFGLCTKTKATFLSGTNWFGFVAKSDLKYAVRLHKDVKDNAAFRFSVITEDGSPLEALDASLGLGVQGVAVNRIVERSIMPVFTAREMRSRGQMLQLSGCTVFAGGRTNLVGKATLALKPSPVLAWQGGSLPLDDLLSSKERK